MKRKQSYIAFIVQKVWKKLFIGKAQTESQACGDKRDATTFAQKKEKKKKQTRMELCNETQGQVQNCDYADEIRQRDTNKQR